MPCIHRCVCTDRTFAELLGLARQHGWSLHQLADETRATRNCGRCLPYLEQTLRTGQTVFHHLIDAPSDTGPSQPERSTQRDDADHAPVGAGPGDPSITPAARPARRSPRD